MNSIGTPWVDVRKNQNNKSKSKATYAFPKERRFRSTSKSLCDSFYNIPSKLGQSQASGIGRGKKASIYREVNSPSPNKYQIKSYFNDHLIGGKIGVGRENMKYGGIFEEKNTPEPGRYKVALEVLDTKRHFSIRSKTKLLESSAAKNPGPGHYSSLNTLNETGRYIVSGIKNCPSSKIVQGKVYDVEKYRQVPGPGSYQSKENINSTGRYFNSKFGNSRCRIFSKSIKKAEFVPESKAPGPGSYNFFSQFGAKMR